MTRPRRVPLSLNLLPEARTELYKRATREGHRYPAVLGATLLERALLAPPLAQELLDMIEALTDRLTDDEAPPLAPHTIVAELDKMYSRLKKEASDGESRLNLSSPTGELTGARRESGYRGGLLLLR